jgi:uncharacterized membrane protein required for colicin V production
MSFLDILIVVLAALGLFIGWRLRATTAVFALLAVAAGVWAAHVYAPGLLPSFSSYRPTAARVLAWLAPFAVAVVGVLLAGGLLAAVIDRLQLRWLDHLLGSLLAAGALLVCLAFGLTSCDPHGAKPPAWTRGSALAGPLLKVSGPWLRDSEKLLPALRKQLDAPKP